MVIPYAVVYLLMCNFIFFSVFCGVKIQIFMVHQLLPVVLVGVLSSAEIVRWYTFDSSRYESLVSCELDGARCVM